jgi:hypothetical protein
MDPDHISAAKFVGVGKFVVLIAAAVTLVSCQSDSKAQGRMAFPPPPVSVLEVQAQDVPIYSEYAAQTFARDMGVLGATFEPTAIPNTGSWEIVESMFLAAFRRYTEEGL